MDSTDIDRKIEEQFGCRRCNECCRQPGFVYLAAGEAEAIASFLKTDLYDFTDRCCEVVDRRRLVLKKHADETCIFLEAGGCSIHPAKPVQCREFPFRWRTERSFEYCEGLKRLFGNRPREN